MSLRHRLVVPAIFSALAMLAGCGSSSSPSGTPPPTGGFSNSNLNGTYVFSVSGTDGNGAPYAMVGTLTANGSGGITGGAVDLNDASLSAPVPNAAIASNSSYTIGADGRGRATINTATPFGKVTLDFVLQDSSHGLVTEFDATASGSGTLDVQTAGTTPTGSYAFNLFGANSTGSFAAAGDFTIGSGGSISGLEDLNNADVAYSGTGNAGNTLSGQLVLGPSSTPSTTMTTNTGFGTQTFDAIAIDATHLKLIQMDTAGTLSGDAYSQTSSSMPVGTLPFTLGGAVGGAPFVAGGFIVTDNAGNVTSASSEDFNANGTASSAFVSFSGTYGASPSNAARFIVSFSGFQGASTFVGYPSSAGLFLLEIDDVGILSGVAYPPQSSTTFASGQGYGLNLSGTNIASGSLLEVDDIAEFTATSGGALTGYIDENCAPSSTCGSPAPNISLGTGATFSTGTGGRGQIGTGSTAIGTLNGGFLLTYYTVDGTTVPFIESDGGQVALGVMIEQNASGSAAALAKAGIKHLYVPPMMKLRKAQKQK